MNGPVRPSAAVQLGNPTVSYAGVLVRLQSHKLRRQILTTASRMHCLTVRHSSIDGGAQNLPQWEIEVLGNFSSNGLAVPVCNGARCFRKEVPLVVSMPDTTNMLPLCRHGCGLPALSRSHSQVCQRVHREPALAHAQRAYAQRQAPMQ